MFLLDPEVGLVMSKIDNGSKGGFLYGQDPEWTYLI